MHDHAQLIYYVLKFKYPLDLENNFYLYLIVYTLVFYKCSKVLKLVCYLPAMSQLAFLTVKAENNPGKDSALKRPKKETPNWDHQPLHCQ